MSVPFSSTKLRLPEGFNALIHKFCYEILKYQPEDIHAFGALYFADLLEKREGRHFEEEQIDESGRLETQDENSSSEPPPSSKKEDLPECTEEVAPPILIQPKADDESKSIDVAATKIQAGVRGMQVRRNLNSIKRDHMETTGDEEKAGEEKKEDAEGDDGGDDDDDERKKEEAATKIQSGVRGMKVRRQVKQQREESKCRIDDLSTGDKDEEDDSNDDGDDDASDAAAGDDDDDDDDDDENDDDDEDRRKSGAATKIQAGYKGMKTTIETQADTGRVKHEIEDEDNEEEDDEDDEGKRKTVDERLLNHSATKIQAGVRGMKTRRELRERQTKFERSQSLCQPQSLPMSQEEIYLAATKIQAGMRGMKVRRELKKHLSEGYDLSPQKGASPVFPVSVRDEEELNKAAAKIQAGARGLKVRRDFKRRMSESGKDSLCLEKEKAAVKIQAGVRGMKTRLELKNRRQMTLDESRSGIEPLDEEDEEDKEKDEDNPAGKGGSAVGGEKAEAATKIQAGVRGMQVRRSIKRRRSLGATPLQDDSTPLETTRKLDPDLAATKIQAGVRGMKTRREMKEKKQQQQRQPINGEDESRKVTWQYGQSSVDLGRAATKIQAGVRGMKTRRDLDLRKGAPQWKTFDAPVERE